MNIGMTVFGLATLAILALAMVLTPSMSRPTVPLGVSVPRARVNSPVVARATSRYRRWCIALAVVATVGLVSTRTHGWSLSVWLLSYAAAGMVVFAVCRRPIIAAKHAEGWYDGVPVRVVASVTRQESPVSVAWPVHLLSIALATVGLVTLAVAYSGLPDPFPVHYDANGNADRWAEKSLLSVFAAPTSAVLGSVAMLAICLLVARRHDPFLPDGDPGSARRVAGAQAQNLQRGVAWVSVAMSVLLGVISLSQVGRLSPAATSTVVWGATLAMLVPTVWLVWNSARIQRNTPPTEGGGPDSPDDDQLWKWGLFYINPHDPRAFVPKRNGTGLDPNLGHPAGQLLVGVSGALLVFAIASALLGH